MTRTLVFCALAATLVASQTAYGADLAKIERRIQKEPAYRSKHPRYALLVFGPDARQRVWLVQDGNTLYVDRKGNGDLTDPADRVSGKPIDEENKDAGFTFEAGELHVDGRVHKRLTVYAHPLNGFADSIKERPNAKAAFNTDPNVLAFQVSLELDWPGLRGQYAGGRVQQSAGVVDGEGVLLFAATAAEAPVIHFGAPVQVTFYDQKPTFKLERTGEIVLVVGTPGVGPGTFASLAYEKTIPGTAHPKLEVQFPSGVADGPPVRASFELRSRC